MSLERVSKAGMSGTIFFTVGRDPDDRQRARLLIESLRRFGGSLADRPFWVFVQGESDREIASWGIAGAEAVPLDADEGSLAYPLAEKVYAAAQAADRAGPGIDSLVFLAAPCLVLRPPELLDLGTACDAAFRPVHIRNVGAAVGEPVDPYWRGVYEAAGYGPPGGTVPAADRVESFVDAQMLRPYYNAGTFSFRPACGLAHAWRAAFETLVGNPAYQEQTCADDRHRLFLHQAVLSACAARMLPAERRRLLPPEYGYPLHLHEQTPSPRRASRLDCLVSVIYDDLDPFLRDFREIEIGDDLRAWLLARAARFRP